MTELTVNQTSGFSTYPDHRVCAILETKEDAVHALEEIKAKGIKGLDIEIFYGGKGAKLLDADAEHHGFIAKIAKALRSYGDMENEMMHIYEKALQEGSYVFQVLARSDEEKETIRRVLEQYHAREINYFSQWYVEAL
jgi:hypothetical protein